MDFKRNNLDKSNSPYLFQHKDNPINWQEWNEEVLAYAKKEKKLILVSSGYSTCHWCHVMAEDTFSNEEVAKRLEENFICIKLDREERPEIDQYLMSFMTKAYGQGGWPLNVILSPEQIPFFATTYAGSEPKFGQPAFTDILDRVESFYEENKTELVPFKVKDAQYEYTEEEKVIEVILNNQDKRFGGIGLDQKFPSHNTITFLLHYYEETKNESVKSFLEKALDSMMTKGLYDHLAGGFFRYTVDREWLIPHFEKMLYDQAMLISNYSLAYKLFGRKDYGDVVEKSLECLKNHFYDGKFYYAGLDADTNHEEGLTYTWTREEVEEVLGDLIGTFDELYELVEFEGRGHIIKKSSKSSSEVEDKLYEVRNTREQPFVDKKIMLAWNSYVGIALIQAYRSFEDERLLKIAKKLHQDLLDTFFVNDTLHHSLFEGKLSGKGVLEDYSSFFLFSTYIFEEKRVGKELLEHLFKELNKFRTAGMWYESRDTEIGDIYAQNFDHPTPSSISMAEFGLLRYAILFEIDYHETQYATGLNYDFYNLGAFISKGNFHVVVSNEKISWLKLPINTIQLKSKSYKDCYKGACRQFDSFKELIKQFS